MVNVTNLLVKTGSGVGFSFGVKAWTEMEIRCVKGNVEHCGDEPEQAVTMARYE